MCIRDSYKLFAEQNVRDLASYNEAVKKSGEAQPLPQVPLAAIPAATRDAAGLRDPPVLWDFQVRPVLPVLLDLSLIHI